MAKSIVLWITPPPLPHQLGYQPPALILMSAPPSPIKCPSGCRGTSQSQQASLCKVKVTPPTRSAEGYVGAPGLTLISVGLDGIRQERSAASFIFISGQIKGPVRNLS